ncbi:SMP-30/gluconolactonase/LRE family protein [Henriciella litoralis]|uniref:SMP-30/gluconolactonase/LRE family protein n=1 Tax=Henriciella litoralis TaxID=568102 RepID=UPI001469E022|nr:SMP-30/gluconolactonase/LRE family protein [Henriciella litoralis]
MSISEPQCVAPTSCLLGQSPVWSASEGLLWWVDPKRAKLHRYKPKTGNTRRYDLPLKASVIALAGGELLMAGDLECGFFDTETEEYNRLIQQTDVDVRDRINSGGVGPDGSFWFSTMDGDEIEARSRWFRMLPDRSVEEIAIPPVIIPSTVCFSADGSTMYTSDTTEQEILAFDYDAPAGLSNRRVFATTSNGAGYPDGAALDAEGCIWVAEWDGARVVRYRSDGKLDRVVKLPTSRPTACCFGGPGLRTLYITTARTGLTTFQMDTQPFAGSLFALEVECPGNPCHSWTGR